MMTDMRKALEPFVYAYLKAADPGTSDLDDEQPFHITVPLGACRRARAVYAAALTSPSGFNAGLEAAATFCDARANQIASANYSIGKLPETWPDINKYREIASAIRATLHSDGGGKP